MRFFTIASLALLVVASSHGATLQTQSLSSLVGIDGLIPDKYQTRSGDALGQLKALVNEPTALTQIYAQYKLLFKNAEGSVDAFGKNLLEIAEHNAQFAAGTVGWQMGVTKFTDLTEDEFLSKYTGLVAPIDGDDEEDIQTPTLTSLSDSPDAVNWTAEGIVTPIKNQKSCGSCVTFATAGVVESAYAKKSPSDPQLDLSEQELLDCTKDNNGCQGGWYDPAFKEVEKYGLASEKDYPYQNRQNGFFGMGSCQRTQGNKKNRAITGIASWGKCINNQGDEAALAAGVANYGPVAVAVNANNDWQKYKGGIYSGSCKGRVNHAVMVTGYGSDNGKDYWIIKNSWDTTWGEQGYMRLARNADNKCQVADHCYYATA